MPGLTTTIGPWTLPTFTLVLALAFVSGTLLVAHRLRSPASPGQLADCALGALIGGVLGARLVHVLLHWEYFASHTGDIARLSAGGLNWHGMALGALLGLVVVSHVRAVPLRPLLDALTVALPLLAFGGWYACWAAACGYGAEVDTLARYPAFVVSEARDVYGIIAPRYNTQGFGLALALGAGIVALVLLRYPGLRHVRFWLVLGLLSAGMFAIGFVRGDAVPILAGLRADQWLDLCLIALSLVAAGYEARVSRRPRSSGLPLPIT